MKPIEIEPLAPVDVKTRELFDLLDKAESTLHDYTGLAPSSAVPPAKENGWTAADLERALNLIAEPLGWKFHETEFGPLSLRGSIACPCGATEYWSFQPGPAQSMRQVAELICKLSLSRSHLVHDVENGTLPPSALEAYDQAVARLGR
jgi:hypothetical protein